MKKSKSIEFLGVTGHGATKAIATENAKSVIKAAFDGYYTPRLLKFDKCDMLIVRDPLSGWQYHMILADQDEMYNYGDNHITGCWHGGYATAAECERGARRHAAQVEYEYGGNDGSSAILVAFEDDRREHMSLVRFWDAFNDCKARLIKAGIDKDTAHWAADVKARYIDSSMPMPEEMQSRYSAIVARAEVKVA